jgi:hypothetical protein
MKADSRARARAVETRALQDERAQSETPLPPPRPSTVALTLIALILGLFAIRAGAALIIPLLLSLFLNYALSPVVTRLTRWGVPRFLGAALVVRFQRRDTGAILSQQRRRRRHSRVPPAVQRLRIALTHRSGTTPALEHVQRTASGAELAEAASPAPARP